MRYPKECVLKECQEVVIRPLELDDEPLLRRFFDEIPEADRWYMRYDVTDTGVIKKWFEHIDSDTVDSIIALCGDRIVGHGSLHVRGFGSTRHVGRFRIIIHPEFRLQRLGTWLTLDLIQLAMDKGLEILRTDLVVGLEDVAIDAVRKLDFVKRAEIKDYAKDPEGNHHNLAVMIKRLHRGWGDF
jgi:ribosomal protein S18 acetylase RimI-like enzyme